MSAISSAGNPGAAALAGYEPANSRADGLGSVAAHKNPLAGLTEWAGRTSKLTEVRTAEPFAELYARAAANLEKSGARLAETVVSPDERAAREELIAARAEVRYFTGDDKKFREVLEKFEATFLGMIMREARKTLNPEKDILGNGTGQQWFTEYLDDAYADLGSKTGTGSGIKEMMYREYVGHVRAEAGLAKTGAAMKDYSGSVREYSRMIDKIG